MIHQAARYYQTKQKIKLKKFLMEIYVKTLILFRIIVLD